MYQCKNCGGNLKYDIATQSMHCDYCDSSFNPYDVTKDTDAMEDNYYEATVFRCPQCGAELISSDTDATSFCSYCGAANVLTGRISHEKRPARIIPFQITKEQCKEIYAKKMKRAFFAPKELTDPAYIDSFRGIYMPYWSYNFEQNGHLNLEGQKSYRRGDYIYTDYYALEGDVNASYEGYTFDASSSFFDNVSENLLPFHAKDEKEFTPSYLSGFYADTADIPKEVYEADAKNHACSVTKGKIIAHSDFSTYGIRAGVERMDMENKFPIQCTDAQQLLYPVWFLSYRKNDRIAYAAINGQTGKLFMDTPIDFKKYGITTAILALILFIFLNINFTFKPTTLLFTSAVLAVISALLYLKEINDIHRRNENLDDKGLQSKNTTSSKKNLKISETGGSLGFWSAMASVFLCMVIAFINPVDDLYYYLGAIASMIGVLVTLTSIMKNYNVLATRKLPQFNKQGGDDLA